MIIDEVMTRSASASPKSRVEPSHSSFTTTTVSLVMPRKIADAARIAPYLTHVVSHHGQLTLIPPENAGRIRQDKPKKSKLAGPKQDRKSRREENSGTAPTPSTRIIPVSQPSSRCTTTISTGHPDVVRNNESSFHQQRRFQESRYSDGRKSFNLCAGFVLKF